MGGLKQTLINTAPGLYNRLRQSWGSGAVSAVNNVVINSVKIDNGNILIDGTVYLSEATKKSSSGVEICFNEDAFTLFEKEKNCVLPFHFSHPFPDEFKYISFRAKKEGTASIPLFISYTNEVYKKVIRDNCFIWGTEQNLYCDEFVGDFGQSLAIRHLREHIAENAVIFSTLNTSAHHLAFFDNFINDISYINKRLDSIYPELSPIPGDIQTSALCYLSTAFFRSVDMYDCYKPEIPDTFEGWQQVRLLLRRIDDQYIKDMNTSELMRVFILSVKYGSNAVLTPGGSKDKPENLIMSYGGIDFCSMSGFNATIFRIEHLNGKIHIDGGFQLPSGIDVKAVIPLAFINGRESLISRIENMNDRHYFDLIYMNEVGFELDIEEPEDYVEIRFGFRLSGSIVNPDKYLYSKNICPLTKATECSYMIIGNKVVLAGDNKLVISPYDEEDIIRRECLLKDEAFADKKLSRRSIHEMLFIRSFHHLYYDGYSQELFNELLLNLEALRVDPKEMKVLKKLIRRYVAKDAAGRSNKVWVLLDRPDRADDNAEALFRYLKRADPESTDVYFMLSSNAAAYSELKDIGEIIEPTSVSHCALHAIAEYVISSQMQEFVINPFNEKEKYIKDICKKPKIIFLQHGVIHNHHGKVMGKYGRNFKGFITSGRAEYEYIKSDHFHYTEDEVWLTGLARFDRLYDDDKRIITIMPTWRQWLTHRAFDSKTNTLSWVINDGFENTEYFRFYESLLNDERLISAADKYGYTIAFLPHVNFLHLAGLFKHPPQVEVYEYEKPYREMFAESSLVITDYTSAVFDFAYLRKPLIYCQFDKDDFYSRHSVKKGYFDFDRDGLGDVTYDKDTLVDVIIGYMENGCAIKDEYKKKMDEFFPNTDRNCCERIYHHLLEHRDE